MIKNESLGKRLNDFKNKPNDNPSLQTEAIFQTLGTIYLGIIVVLKTFVYGYGLKIIFHTDWNFWSVICIGLGTHFILSYFHNLIHDTSDSLNL
jgi:cell division protein FtsW (lipid II flippase)